MTMSFSAITDEDILIEEGTFAMNFKASGAILAGQALQLEAEGDKGTAYVGVCQDSKEFNKGANRFIGVAEYSADHGDSISVLPVGNKVTVRASGAITAGHGAFATSKGYFMASNTTTSGNIQAVALETFQNDEAGVVLLV
jgi:hypothetical protein